MREPRASPFMGRRLSPEEGSSHPESGDEGGGRRDLNSALLGESCTSHPHPSALGWTAPSWICPSLMRPLGGSSGVREAPPGPPQTAGQRRPGWGSELGESRPLLCPSSGPLGDSGELIPRTRSGHPLALRGRRCYTHSRSTEGKASGWGALPPREAADVFGPGALSSILCSRQ